VYRCVVTKIKSTCEFPVFFLG